MDSKHRFILWTTVLVAAITLLPFLGLTDFTTKGEPREAVVAVSMLNQNNWILPENNGVDIPYKPPFYQWCIAAFSLPIGHVNEFTSRLPSALALIIMLAMGAVFFAKRKNNDLSFLAAMMTLTAFEVHRAGTNCRVDMVLTMFIVCALYAFYRWWEKSGKGMPWLAILCMSGATLTKGPVGIVLPCFVMVVFMAMQKIKAVKTNLQGGMEGLSTFLKLFFAAILACVLPAMWYLAAYQQGGKEFLDLVLDENVGRFLGKMKFVTHSNPWHYNILMLVSGWLPWTLPMLLSLFVLPWRKFSRSAFACSVKKAEPVQVFTWLSFLLILFFYCIPESKRGVYLLPCYPFMAVLMVEYGMWFIKKSAFPIRFYIGLLAVAGILLTAAVVVVRAGAVPDSIFHGKHAYENIKMLHALAYSSLGFGDIVLLMLPLCASCLGLMVLLRRNVGFITRRPVLASTVMTLLIFMAFDGYYKPTIMNTKSLRPFAMNMKNLKDNYSLTLKKDYNLYAFTGFSEPGSDPLRFYGVDFYLGDSIRQFDKDLPKSGLLMVNTGNKKTLADTFNKDYSFTEAFRSNHRETEFKDTIYVYFFDKKKVPSSSRR